MKTEQRPVLVATEDHDTTADMVISHLNQRGVPVARFNPADIGTALRVSARIGTCPASVAGQVRTPTRTVALEHVRSVYWRRPVWPQFEHLPDQDSRYTAAQVRYGLGGVLHALNCCQWVNHPQKIAAADYKPAQLAVAHRLRLAPRPRRPAGEGRRPHVPPVAGGGRSRTARAVPEPGCLPADRGRPVAARDRARHRPGRMGGHRLP